MNLLDKLDMLMNEKGLNKRTLSQSSGVPYTTIVGLYTKGYEGVRMNTIKSIARFFGVSTDYLIQDDISDRFYGLSISCSESSQQELTSDEQKLIDDYRTLNDQGKEHIRVCMASAQALFKENSADISSLESKSS